MLERKPEVPLPPLPPPIHEKKKLNLFSSLYSLTIRFIFSSFFLSFLNCARYGHYYPISNPLQIYNVNSAYQFKCRHPLHAVLGKQKKKFHILTSLRPCTMNLQGTRQCETRALWDSCVTRDNLKGRSLLTIVCKLRSTHRQTLISERRKTMSGLKSGLLPFSEFRGSCKNDRKSGI